MTHVFVQNSIDGGITWNTLGQAASTGTTSNWQLSGLTLPLTGQIRVLGRTSGSLLGGSQGLVSAVQSYAFSPPLTPIEIWRQQFFGTTANSGNAADDFDFDKDGLANLVEYAFGFDPTQGGGGQLPMGQIEGSDFVIRFTAPAGLGGITYGVESSTTLQPGNFAVVPDTGIAPEHVFRVPMGTRTRMFMRILVTRP